MTKLFEGPDPAWLEGLARAAEGIDAWTMSPRGAGYLFGDAVVSKVRAPAHTRLLPTAV